MFGRLYPARLSSRSDELSAAVALCSGSGGDPSRLHRIVNFLPSPYLCNSLPAAPFDRQMASEIPHSIARGQKDEENPHSDAPTLVAEPLDTQEKPAVRSIKLAFARNFPRTYRITSKVLLYLRGPRPKRDLDGAFLSCDTN